MSVNPIAEEDLWAALRPFRVDSQTFEAAVRTKISSDTHEHEIDHWAGFSPLVRAAASFLPLTVLGCRGTLTAAKLAPTSASAKLVGYLAFPAISLFVLLGATVMSVLKIRGVRWQNGEAPAEQVNQNDAICRWWSDHKWGAGAVFGTSLSLGLFGASWLLFLFYILSFGILIHVITTLAKLGIGNRFIIGSSCLHGLMFLGQIAAFPGVGTSDIHFLDQSLVSVLFFGGAVAMVPILWLSVFPINNEMASPRWTHARTANGGTIACWAFVIMMMPLMAWMLYPTLWSPTPPRIKNYVESFDHAPFHSVSWQHWEIPASWAMQSKLDPDFSKVRQLLAAEIAGEQNPFILGSAIRVGLMSADQIDQIKAYDAMRRSMVQPSYDAKPQTFTSLEQLDWVIRAAVLRDDLSTADRDLLEQRLHATLRTLPDESFVTLVDMLRATQLLDVIKRPVNAQDYRKKIHDLLREFHSQDSGGFERSGGFRSYRKSLIDEKKTWTQILMGSRVPGDSIATSNAIELMAIYGVPDGLDLNSVRSFLRPMRSGHSDRKWVAAVTLDRLNHLPDSMPPNWIDYLCYERTMIAAAVLVGLCIFATLSSPIPRTANTKYESKPSTSSSQVN